MCKLTHSILAMPSTVGEYISTTQKNLLQGEDLEKFAHVHKEICTGLVFTTLEC